MDLGFGSDFDLRERDEAALHRSLLCQYSILRKKQKCTMLYHVFRYLIVAIFPQNVKLKKNLKNRKVY